MCGDVLERLSDYIDGDLPDSERLRVDAHLRGCDWCESFGGELSTLVRALRRELASSAQLDDDRARRLHARLAEKSEA